MAFLLILILLFPLSGFLILGTGFRRIPRKVVSVIGPAVVLIPFVFSLILFFSINPETSLVITLFDWISAGTLHIPFALLLDPLSSLMLLIVTGVGSVIHIYSIGYMDDDPGYNRFFAYMNLFIFSMVLLVMGSNYAVMFIGWEGVGLCSYLLIGFWFKNHEFNNAARKAFIMNRIGDLGFLLGMILLFTTFGTLDYAVIFAKAGTLAIGAPVILGITLLLFVGAVGKSAQIPLYTWLPDAMAGPTPVSALIHAATMVTAGVYMVARSNILYAMSPVTMSILAATGLATALFAAIIAIFQNDIKKVLAYSTISQLGYMFLGLGTGAFTGAMFHLTTHAFFKALLFLAAGSVIHALSGEQDIRKMGGLKNKIPVIWWMFLIGTVSISGMPPFSGFFSKDEILSSAFQYGSIVWILAVAGALMTAFYMFRLLFLTFLGTHRGEAGKPVHESPKVMIIPLGILALFSLIGGFFNVPALFGGGSWMNQWLQPVFSPGMAVLQASSSVSHETEWILALATLMGVVLMIFLAWKRFGKGLPEEKDTLVLRILRNKFYIDEIYDFLIIKPIFWLSKVFYQFIELKFIDAMVNGFGNLVIRTGSVVRFLQAGNVGFYLFVMVFSIIGILVYNMLMK